MVCFLIDKKLNLSILHNMKDVLLKRNSYYEGLLQNLYAGAKGCFSAFMHFFYQYNQSVVFGKQYSECFFFLYNRELENCNIISQILIKMGGDNKYYSSSRKFLSGYNVDYVKHFAKIFLQDIEILEVNIIEVKNIILKIDDLKVKQELLKILSNKKEELKILKEIYFKNNMIN